MSERGKEKANSNEEEDMGPAESPPDIIRGVLINDFTEVSAALIRDPASINSRRQDDGMPALHCAIERGFMDMTSYLIKCPKINILIEDRFGRDPLDFAIDIGHEGIIDILFIAFNGIQNINTEHKNRAARKLSVKKIDPVKPKNE